MTAHIGDRHVFRGGCSETVVVRLPDSWLVTHYASMSAYAGAGCTSHSVLASDPDGLIDPAVFRMEWQERVDE